MLAPLILLASGSEPTYSLFQLRSHTEFHVGMECGLFEYFGMGWGNAQLHYVMTARAAASEGSDTVEISYAFGEINLKSPPKSCLNKGQKSEIKQCAS